MPLTSTGLPVVLQKLEMRFSIFIHDHGLAVQDHIVFYFGQRFHYRRKMIVERQKIARVKFYFALTNFSHGAKPIPFDFKNPSGSIERFFDQRGQHRFDMMGHFHLFDLQVLWLFAIWSMDFPVKTDLSFFVTSIFLANSSFSFIRSQECFPAKLVLIRANPPWSFLPLSTNLSMPSCNPLVIIFSLSATDCVPRAR